MVACDLCGFIDLGGMCPESLKPCSRVYMEHILIVDRRQFERTYFEIIENRHFVEYPEYYRHSVDRFWKAFEKINLLDLTSSTRVLDVGGGIMALLIHRLLGLETSVGDVNRRAAGDIEDFGVQFQEVDLLSDKNLPKNIYDLVVIQEVIEHLPHPPYVVFERIKKFLSPGGKLFLTTPNAARVRNIAYYLTGRQVLDNFRYPDVGEALGHQMEYTLPQMEWQLDRASFSPIFAIQYDDGWAGASLKARLAHTLLKPINIIPHLRNGLMIAAEPYATNA